MAQNIFNALPQVKKCCFFVDLETGCIIIGVIYLIFVAEAVFGRSASKELNRCYYIDPFMQGLGVTALMVWATTLIVTLVFMYGIVKRVHQTALFFMYTTIILLIFNLIMSIVLVFHSHKECASPYLFGGASFFAAIMLIYFLIVVNSYHQQLVTTKTITNQPSASQPTASKATASQATASQATASQPADSELSNRPAASV